MKISDYQKVIALWQNAEGVKLRDADSKNGIEKYLLRNPKLSFVAEINGTQFPYLTPCLAEIICVDGG